MRDLWFHMKRTEMKSKLTNLHALHDKLQSIRTMHALLQSSKHPLNN